MNDIHEARENGHAIPDANDTTLFSALGFCNVALNGTKFDKHVLSTNVDNNLSEVEEWLKINKLSINVSNTKCVVFHNHQRNINSLIPDIRIKNQATKSVSEFNIHALTIYEHLNWNV